MLKPFLAADGGHFIIKVDSNDSGAQSGITPKGSVYDDFHFAYKLKEHLHIFVMRTQPHSEQHYVNILQAQFLKLDSIPTVINDTFNKQEIGSPIVLALINAFAHSVLHGDVSWFKPGTDMQFFNEVLTIDHFEYEFNYVTPGDPQYVQRFIEEFVEQTAERDQGGDCKLCGETGHICIETLPDKAYYEAYGATTSDIPANDSTTASYNYCGEEPMGYDGDVWPICPKHGPLLFLWQMTDQQPFTGEDGTQQYDPCIIQMFACATWYKGKYDEHHHVSMNLRCYEGEYLNDNDCRVQFDVGSYKNFAYFTKRFYPRPGWKFLQRPIERGVNRIVSEGRGHFPRIKVEKRKHPNIEQEAKNQEEWDNRPEQQEKERIIPKKYLVWEKIKIPHTEENARKIFKPWEKDPGNFILMGHDGTVPLVMHINALQDALRDAERDLNPYALLHNTLGRYQQHPGPVGCGYVFMIQEEGYLGVAVHGNPAGGIGITQDLTAHFVL
jgi:hypothetical protein